jgi:hypothetical protein
MNGPIKLKTLIFIKCSSILFKNQHQKVFYIVILYYIAYDLGGHIKSIFIQLGGGGVARLNAFPKGEGSGKH